MSLGWSKVDEALFAATSARNGARYQIIAEQLPDTDGWDWAVWRLGDAPATARHGDAFCPSRDQRGRGCGPALGRHGRTWLARRLLIYRWEEAGRSLNMRGARSARGQHVSRHHVRSIFVGDPLIAISPRWDVAQGGLPCAPVRPARRSSRRSGRTARRASSGSSENVARSCASSSSSGRARRRRRAVHSRGSCLTPFLRS
jgi:hypothetical protein